jgi:hypothetical protein
MIIKRGINGETILYFPKIELGVVYQILKALYAIYKRQFFNADFIKECTDDMEAEMRPRLTMVVENHLCEKCFTFFNSKDENSLKIDRDGDVTWRHKVCPEQKKD